MLRGTAIANIAVLVAAARRSREYTAKNDNTRYDVRLPSGTARLVLVSCLFALGIVPGLGLRTAEGHGYMIEPRSRSVDHLKGDPKGWPIAGVPPYLTRVPCLELPVNNQFTEVHPGPLTLRFVYGDGANHVGLCQVYLLDPNHPAQKFKIAEMMDCARSDHPGPGHKGEDIHGHMVVNIPDSVPCDPAHCVLKWEWIATHRNVTHPEYYDECADLRIIGARQVQPAVTAQSPMKPQRREEQAPDAPRPAPPMAGPAALATGEDLVRQLISYAMADAGVGNTEAIMTLKRQLEALPLNRHVEPGAYQRARAANERGLQILREGRFQEAVQAFHSAY